MIAQSVSVHDVSKRIMNQSLLRKSSFCVTRYPKRKDTHEGLFGLLLDIGFVWRQRRLFGKADHRLRGEVARKKKSCRHLTQT